MRARYDVVVIGAGHNGLVAAAYLARAGRRVLVLERSDDLGGAAVTSEFHPGFRVNSGAHWVGMRASMLTELGIDGVVTVADADPAVFAPHPDGRALVFRQSLSDTVASISAFSARDAERWPGFGTLLGQAAGLLRELYAGPPPDMPMLTWGDLPALLKTGRYLRGLGKRPMMEVIRLLQMSVAELMDEWFETDLLQGSVATAGIIGISQGPMASGTAAALVHQELGSTMSYVPGGIGALSRALADAVWSAGGEVRTASTVASILVNDGTVTGVALASGEEVAAPIVVSNADPRRTFALVDPGQLDLGFLEGVDRIRYRGAAAKVHLALDGLPTFTAAGGDTTLLGGAVTIAPSIRYLERAADDAKYGRMSREPYLDVVIPTIGDPSLAPPGKHVMSIFAQYAPYHLRDAVWDTRANERLGDAVLGVLRQYSPDLAERIIAREVLSPLDLETRFGLTEGSITHGELLLDQFFFARPLPELARYRSPIEGLYLCGAGMHGGGGVNGVPGRNAAKLILRSRVRRRRA